MRWALVSTGPRSLIATTSMSVRPDSMIARSTFRPIRPNPLIATFTAISSLLSVGCRAWRPRRRQVGDYPSEVNRYSAPEGHPLDQTDESAREKKRRSEAEQHVGRDRAENDEGDPESDAVCHVLAV